MSFLKTVGNDPEFPRDCQINERCHDDQYGQIATFSEITEGMILNKESNTVELTRSECKLSLRFQESESVRYSKGSDKKPGYRRKIKRELRMEKKRMKELKRKLKRLKALKKKEIEEKLLKLKEVCGQEDLKLDGNDIKRDIYSEKHDGRMKQVFDEAYYAIKERKKPKFLCNEELDAENQDKWTRDESGDPRRKTKRDEYVEKRKKKLKQKIRRLEKRSIQEKRLKLEEDCGYDELIIDNIESNERTKGSSNSVEALDTEDSRIREEGGSTTPRENYDDKHKVDRDEKSHDAKQQFEQEMVAASHSIKMKRKKSTASHRRKKKRSFDDSLKENCFLDGHFSHCPTKIRKREEMYNCSYTSSSFCESDVTSKYTEESDYGTDITKIKHKKKKRSKVKRNLFPSKSLIKKESCSKTTDPNPNFKAVMNTVNDLLHNLNL